MGQARAEAATREIEGVQVERADSRSGGRWPLVSAVVPTVDRPELLKRSVRSILQQDYPGDLECIVVFDGTRPKVPDVEVPPRRSLRAIANTRTKGLPGNRNTGYLAARGELLSCCDDDDEWHPAKITTQLRLLTQRPDSPLCVTGLAVRRGDHTYQRGETTTEITFEDLLRSRYIEACPSSSLFSRRLIDEGLLVDENIEGGYAEDYEWLLRIARRGPLVCVPEPLTIIHFHDESLFVGNWSNIVRGLTHLLKAIPEFADDPVGLARIEGQMAFAHAALGNRHEALRLAVRSLRRSRKIRQSYAALLVTGGIVSAERVAATARRFGMGV